MSETNSHTLSNLSELRSKFPTIQLYFKGESLYNDLNLYYNRALEHTPLAIVRPKSENDVSNIVACCSKNGIRLAVRSGGHDFFGRSTLSDGIVLDMRDLDFVNIASDNKTARVGGGVIAGPLQEALEARGFFTPTGQVKTVGYVSWACGGGYGFYVGSYGFGVDQILGARVVLADGSVSDTDDDKEMLWALRGAGAGTFGVVVELRIKIYPSPKLLAGFLGFPISEAAKVFESFKNIESKEGIPDELSGDAIVARPEMLGLSGAEPCFIFYWCWTTVGGDISPAKVYLERMKSLGTVLINTVIETTPASFGGGDSSSATFFRSCTVSGLEPTLGEIFARHLPPQPLAGIVIHSNHGLGVRSGVMDGIGAVFPNRRRHIILGLHGGTSIDPQPIINALSHTAEWVTNLKGSISTSGTLMNHAFPSFAPQDEVDPVAFFGPEAADRLFRLKRRLDGDDLFHKGFSRLSQMGYQISEGNL
ncbi:hypothetical protein Daus18300_008171 [Diaporthe australafricana]|uniref:FAD-binding PCMH-type domain-containing protein n=1 Tax=Diaporthe australafricana TaxID=127596 RepID=A0ABR3WJJ4_9PEZI